MGELESTEQKHLREVPQAELVPQTAEYDLENDVCRQLEVIEWRPASLITFTRTPTAAEFRVAEIRGLIQLPELWRLAMRADHEQWSATSG
jgi:hypothetical protein